MHSIVHREGEKMAVTSITGQATPTVKTCGISGANGISSSTTVTRLSSTTISNVSSATIRTTPSTTQTVNSSKTSSVKYSSATISSSTTIASSTISSKTASTTASAISSSTTSRVASTTISSSTTVSSTTSASTTSSTTNTSMVNSSSTTISSVSSNTPTTVTIKMYSSATPEGKYVTIEIPVEHKTDDRTDDAKEMIKDRLNELNNENIELGVSYSLGEMPVYLGGSFVKFSSEIELHENDKNAIVSYSSEIDASVDELTDFFTDEMSLEFFEGGTLSFSEKTMTMCLEKDGYSLEVDMVSFSQYKLDVTVSKSTELGDTATITNSINIVKDIDKPEDTNIFEEAWNSVCEGVGNAVEWVVDNVKEIGIAIGTTIMAGEALSAVAAGASSGPVAATAMLAVVIYKLYEDSNQEVQ